MRGGQPTVAGRGLGAELRSIREERNLSSRKVANQLGWPQSKVSKIENGKQGVTAADVASLLAIYAVTGFERDRLVVKAEKADEPGFFESQGGLSRESRTLIQLESEAVSHFNFEPLVIPGLLQTPDYTRSIMQAAGVPEEETEVRVAARMGRQALLSREHPPELEFAIDEGVLRRNILPPRLLARQLRHVVEASERPHVTIWTLPLALGAHTGLDGSFGVIDLPKGKSVAYLEHKISGTFLEESHEVEFYRAEADRLRQSALSPDESVAFIAAIAEEQDPE